MTRLDVALDVLLLAAILLSAWRARRHPEHRPVALLLALWLPTTLVRRALRLLVFEPGRAAMVAVGLDPGVTPWTGVARLARHANDAALLVWGWGLVAVAVAVLLHGRLLARWVAVPYATSLAVLVLGYPALRYHALAVALLALHACQVAALVGVVAVWLRRRAALVQPGRTQGLVLVLAVLHLALTLPLALMALPAGPHRGAPTPNPFASWYLVQGQYVAIYVVAILACWHPSTPWRPWQTRSVGSGTGSSPSASPSPPPSSSPLHSLASSSSTSAR